MLLIAAYHGPFCSSSCRITAWQEISKEKNHAKQPVQKQHELERESRLNRVNQSEARQKGREEDRSARLCVGERQKEPWRHCMLYNHLDCTRQWRLLSCITPYDLHVWLVFYDSHGMNTNPRYMDEVAKQNFHDSGAYLMQKSQHAQRPELKVFTGYLHVLRNPPQFVFLFQIL